MKKRNGIAIKLILALVSILIVTLNIDCQNKEKFKSEIWKQKGVDWWMTDFREKMVNDLIESDTLIGLNKGKIIDLLGEPDKNEVQKLEYLIREKYSSDIDPDYISDLIIYFDTNGISTKSEISKSK